MASLTHTPQSGTRIHHQSDAQLRSGSFVLFIVNILSIPLFHIMLSSNGAIDYHYISFSLSLFISIFTLIYTFNGISIGGYFILSYIALYYTSPMLSYMLIGDFKPRRISLVENTVYLCIISFHIFLASYAIGMSIKGKINYIIFSENRIRIISLFMISVFSIACVWMLMSVGGFSSIEDSRVDLKYITGSKIYAQWLMYFSSISILLSVITLIKIKYNMIYFIILILFIAAMEWMVFLSLRNRTTVLMHFMALPIGIYISRLFHADGLSLRPKPHSRTLLLSIGFLIFAFGLIAIALRFARGIQLEGGDGYDLQMMIDMTLQGGDLGYIVMAMDAIDYIERSGAWLHGQSYLRLLHAFLPESILGPTPPTTQSLIGRELTGLDVQTIPPSIFGDSYINFGYYGFALFIIYGLIISIFDNYFKTIYRALMFGIIFPIIFHFVRGAFENPIIISIIIMSSIFFVNLFIREKR